MSTFIFPCEDFCSMHRNVYLPDETNELLDEVTALVDRMDPTIPSHTPPFVTPIDFPNIQSNGEEPSRFNEIASSSYCSRVDVSMIPCHVCGDRTSGTHYGVLTCEGCKGFFRRFRSRAADVIPSCNKQNDCVITKDTRNRCQACRYRKCLQVGMHKDNVKFGRKSKQDLAELRRKADHCNKLRNFSLPTPDYLGGPAQPFELPLDVQLSINTTVSHEMPEEPSDFDPRSIPVFKSFPEPSTNCFNQRGWSKRAAIYRSAFDQNGGLGKQQNGAVSVKTEHHGNSHDWPEINYKPTIAETEYRFDSSMAAPMTSIHFPHHCCTSMMTSSCATLPASSFPLTFGNNSRPINNQCHARDVDVLQNGQHSVHVAMISMGEHNNPGPHFDHPHSTPIMDDCAVDSVFSRRLQC